MAKQSGIGARFLVGGSDVSGDISAVDSITGTIALLDGTDITQGAHARIFGLRDGSMTFTAFMDAANAHPVLSALPRTDEIMTALIPPLAIGSPAACLNAKQIDYDPTRGADGSLMLKSQGQGSGFGLEWGLQLTAGTRTDTAATHGAALDNGASSAHGGQAYLHVPAFTGTDATVLVEHSADNTTFTTLMTFTQVTGATPLAQRLAVSGATTVNRYLRASTVTTGGFTSLAFQLTFCRNPVAVTF